MASTRVERVVAAAAQDVFDAFTRPEEIRKWHVPGPDFHVCIAETDLQVGGRYRIGMQPPDREEPHTFYGVYREVSPGQRLVYTSNWEPPDRDTGETLVTIELTAQGESSLVVVTHDGLPDEESCRRSHERLDGNPRESGGPLRLARREQDAREQGDHRPGDPHQLQQEVGSLGHGVPPSFSVALQE